MFRAFSLAAALLAAAVVFAGGSSARTPLFPDVIQLPRGFQPEGIEIGNGPTFYVGSVANGAVYRGSLRTGAGAILVPGVTGNAATGIELDSRNRLWVSGAGTGKANIYNARTGALIKTYTFATSDTFINDAVVTKNAAYFTDSRKAVLYRVPIGAGGALGNAQTVQLGGDFVLTDGFNLNGIDATANGAVLIADQTSTGKLFRINPATGVARQISLGGQTLPNADGILLAGRALFVVQNQLNRIAAIALSANLGSGRVVVRVTDRDFSVPTTIDNFGKSLYAVNARFGIPNPTTAAYQVVRVDRPKVVG